MNHIDLTNEEVIDAPIVEGDEVTTTEEVTPTEEVVAE